MADPTTARLGLSLVQATDNVSDYPATQQGNMGILDGAVSYSQGTLGAIPAAAVAGRVYRATDDLSGGPAGTFYVDSGSLWYRLGATPLVNALPSSPINGQTCVYQADATRGMNWTLRYNTGSSSAYKWEFVGGSPLVNVITNSEATGSTTYANLGTVGPLVTVPLAGDYDVEVASQQSVDAAGVAYHSYAVGGTGASDVDAASTVAFGTMLGTQSEVFTKRKTGLTASTAIVSKYHTSASANATFTQRRLGVLPVRVG